MKKELQRLDCKFELRASQDKEEGMVEGYASVWGVMDGHGSVFSKGAFAESIRNLRNIKVFWNHNYDITIGRIVEAREDDIGLFVRLKLTTKSSLGKDVYELIKDQAVDSFSIGFIVLDDEFVDGVWHIKKVDLKEVSPVVSPSNKLAVVTGVRKQGEDGGGLALRSLCNHLALVNLKDRLAEELKYVS